MSQDNDNNDFQTDNLLKEINSSLGQQITNELDKGTPKDNNVGNIGDIPKKKLSKKKIAGIVLGVIGILVLCVVFTGNYFMDRINYENDADIKAEVNKDGVKVDWDASDANDVVPCNDKVVNILLIGEEKIHDTTRGRSDSIMVATINQDTKKLVLTSFMRDCYVTIPGYKQGKLNTAYNVGAGPLLLSTIEQNFQIHLDGYVRVDFEAFETIVDKLGGVEIELTANEASYLNRTNYISDPNNRNVVAGVQTLNGNQALGYTRVRKVAGINGEHDDFARTNRQRIVLNAIFDKYKSKSLVDLVAIANDLFPYITTNMTKSDLLSYLATIVSLGTTKLETFRVPMNNSYHGETNGAGQVLVIDFPTVNAELHKELYGVTDGTATTTNPNGSNANSSSTGEQTQNGINQ